MSTPAPVPPSALAAPAKKGFPWLWAIVGCFGVLFLIGAAIVIFSIFVVRKVGQEIESHVKVTKGADGKDVVELKGNDGTSIKVNGDGKEGVEMKGADGTSIKIAGDNKLPDWMPVYPGVKMKPLSSVHTKDEDLDMYSFDTKEAPEDVTKFYNDKLKGDGFESTVNSATSDNKKSSMLNASKKDLGYGVQIVALETDEGHTTVSVNAVKSTKIKNKAKDGEEEAEK